MPAIRQGAVQPEGQGSTFSALVPTVLLLAALLCLPGTGAAAQVSPATVRGTVQDQAGAPIAGATVTANHLGTGQSRTVSSDAEGQFEILQLAPGAYEVRASQSGFSAKTQGDLQLAAGQLATLDLVLEPAPEVSAGATANLIREDQLIGLPLNGRSYSQLATLQAGVSDTAAASDSRGVGGGSLTVAGGRFSSNTFLLDGTNIMDTANSVPRSAAGVQLGSDAVLQVHVFSPHYGAEYGRGSGGVLNSITRSGTNEFHGTAFEFLRNDNLDAAKWKDNTFGNEKPEFKRNQFGFMLAGPVRKERTFFLASYEGMRDRVSETNVDFFPDALAREGMITDRNGNVVRPVRVVSAVKPYLNLFPLPNGGSLGGGIGINAASQFLPTNENFFTVRIDHQLSERDSFFARYNFDDATSRSGQATVLFTTENKSRQQYLTLVGSHIFSPSLLTSVRFGYTRPTEAIDTLASIEIPRSLFFVPDAPQFGVINIPGLDSFGPFFVTPEANVMNSFQFADDVVVQRGAHALKFGLEVHRYRWDVFNSFTKGAVWNFNSLESFLQGGPEGTNLAVALPGSNNRKGFRETLAGFYAQDEYTVSPNLHLNLGLRYEFATIIKDRDGKTVFLPDPVHDQAVQIGPMLKDNPSLRNFSPRLGIAWTPFGSRNLSVRAGFGIYYNQLLEYMVDLQKNSAPFYKRAVRVNFDSSTTFPNAAAAAAGLTFNTPFQVEILDYQNMKTPRVFRYSLALQQELAGGWSLQASYVGARGNHLFRGYESNLFPVPITQGDGSLFFPPNSGPINPAFGAIAITSSDAQSFYNSLQLTANKSLSRGISLRASYTYSKSVDDASTFSSGSTAAATRQYPLMRTLDRGLSNFDIRHNLVLNYFYTLPFGEGKRWGNSGILSQILGGWRMGGIVRFRSGTPITPNVNVRTAGFLFSANRPNLLPGRSNNPILGGPEQYFDPSVYSVPPPGTLGNAGRNTIIGPSVLNLDISLQKEFLLDTKRRLEFRAEFFNLLNHPNFASPRGGSAIIFSAAGRNRTAGRITDTSTPPRQIQFALRLSF
ncbi:MAG: TonB-dependent receptor [Acidobacteria bacterium]|nr:TonB-dependent receptor [Acidobacteriota bacterium]